jgi:hypothetical protein
MQSIDSTSPLSSESGKRTGCPDKGTVKARKPTWPALLLGLIPFVGMCFTVPLWDRIQPFVAGFPFNLFWLMLWILLTPLCLWGAYQFEKRADSGQSGGRQSGAR